MKILYIHNNYASNNSGEEQSAESIVKLLKRNGHNVDWYRRSSSEICNSKFKIIISFFTGIWNPVAVRQIKKKIHEFQPDLIQVQNMYPIISPAILKYVKRAGIPLVMRCPNYRLFCPNGLFMDTKGQVCEKCLLVGREWHCVIKNCEGDFFKSLGYALRNYFARVYWGVLKLIDVYIVQTEFQKQIFVKYGIPEDKLAIVPGLAPQIKSNNKELGNLVSFVGRISPEKGIHEFVEAARLLPQISFIVAGSVGKKMLHFMINSSKNVHWAGFLKDECLDDVYKKSRIIVLPNKCYEGFPNVITRAMQHAIPVIACNIGAMTSIIEHQINGVLVKSGDYVELSKAIENLYNKPDLCKQYGENGRKKALEQYSSEMIYCRLIEIYGPLIRLKPVLD